jgi:hypothetical protein
LYSLPESKKDLNSGKTSTLLPTLIYAALTEEFVASDDLASVLDGLFEVSMLSMVFSSFISSLN